MTKSALAPWLQVRMTSLPSLREEGLMILRQLLHQSTRYRQFAPLT
jgi:hypothetical protein